MIIQIDQGPPNADMMDLVLYNIETDSKKAWDEADKEARDCLRDAGIKPPKNLHNLDKISDGRIMEALYSYVESYQGDYPREAKLTGWYDVYEGEPTFKLQLDMKQIMDESKTLSDVMRHLYTWKGYENVRPIYDEYRDNFTYTMKLAIENIKKAGNKESNPGKWTFNTIAEVRESFWEGMTPLYREEYRKDKRQNEYSADIRMAFVGYIDDLARNGMISENLAQRVTL